MHLQMCGFVHLDESACTCTGNGCKDVYKCHF